MKHDSKRIQNLMSRAVAFLLLICAGLFLALGLTGCGTLGSGIERVSERVGDGVRDYCGEFDPNVREALRILGNEASDPHRICIECAGDPADTGCRIENGDTSGG